MVTSTASIDNYLGWLQVPIAEGASTTLNGFAKSMYADFVHGQDGFGNTNQPSVKVRQATRACVSETEYLFAMTLYACNFISPLAARCICL